MHVVMLGTDKKVFDPTSDVAARIQQYGALFGTLSFIVTTSAAQGFKEQSLREEVTVYPTHSMVKGLYLFDILRICKRLGSSVDVVSAQDPGLLGLAAFIISRKLNAKLHLQIHGDVWNPQFRAQSLRNRLEYYIARRLLRRADGIRVVSQKIKNDIVAHYPALEDRITVLPIYTEGKEADASNRPPVFDRFSKNILIVSRLEEEKNVIRALEIYTKYKTSSVGLVIVGDGALRKNLERYANDHGIAHNVSFEGWQHHVDSYYTHADVFLHVSKLEGYGMVFAEAARRDLPVVSSPVGIMGSLSSEAHAMCVCDVSDTACFLKKIKIFLEDEHSRKRFIDVVKPEIQAQTVLDKETYLRRYKEDIKKLLV